MSVGRTFVAIAGGSVVRQAFAFASQLVVARRIGSVEFGSLTYAFSIYILMAGLGDLGTRLYCWRELARASASEAQWLGTRLLISRTVFTCAVALALNIALSLFSPTRVALLLHLFTVAVVFNQVTVDWLFLGRLRRTRLFAYDLASGLVLFAGCLVTIHGPNDSYWFPVWFAASYLVPAVLLLRGMVDFGAGMANFRRESIGDIRALLRSAVTFAPYDMLQRLYTVFVFLIMWQKYAAAEIGEFRIAYLLYAFGGSVALYFSGAKFNALSREAEPDIRRRLSAGVATVLLVTLPLALLGGDVLRPGLVTVLDGGYGEFASALWAVFFCLPVTATSMYLRECLIPIGETALAVQGYLAAIGITTSLILLLPQLPIGKLPYVLAAGELSSLLLVLIRRRIVALDGRAALLALAGLAVGIALSTIWAYRPDEESAVATFLTLGFIGAAYLGAIALLFKLHARFYAHR